MHCNLEGNELEFEWLMFDFDNTLVDFHETSTLAFNQTFIDFNLKIQPEYYGIYEKINGKIWSEFEQKLITADDIRKTRFTFLFEELQISNIDGFAFNAKYLANIIEFTTIRPVLIDMITELKENYKLSIITNGLKEVQRARLDKCQITSLFDSIIVSDEIGVSKPDKAFFDYTINSIPDAVPRDKILVIGDSIKSDIAGAVNYGLNSCLIDKERKSNSTVADIIVQDVLDLSSILLYPYQPIDCGFYDYLEIYSMRQTLVEIKFYSGSVLDCCIAKIENLITINKAEFAELSNGFKIRLDYIKSIKPSI